MAYKVKSNKELFSKWTVLSAKIKCNGAIIQNDLNISADQIKEFKEYARVAQEELTNLVQETLQYIVRSDLK